MNRLNKKILANIVNCFFHVVFVILAIVFVWMVLAESFATNLCNDIATCYTIVIFLIGIIITLKIKVMDETSSKVELILFIVGVIANILFLSVAYGYDCASISIDSETGNRILDLGKVKSALLILNSTIWVNFVVLLRNIYLVIVIYLKKHNFFKQKNHYIEEKPIKEKIKLEKSIWIYVVIMLLFLFLGIIGLIIRNGLSGETADFDIGILAACISGLCAIVGGLCTLIGVRKTINFEINRDKQISKIANKPELIVPFQCDLANVLKIRFYKEGLEDRAPILNKSIILKNSSKCCFVINELTVNGEIYCSNQSIYIEPNMLFSISFSLADNLDSVNIRVSSLDNFEYNYHIEIKEEKTIKVEEIQC